MATVVMSAVGATIGAGIGGSVLGVSSAVIGRAAGAAIGRAIDQRLMGSSARAIEVGRIDRYRVRGAGEGEALPRVLGTIRVAGHVIWATRFAQKVRRTTTGGGKGVAPAAQVTRSYSYSVSLALALSEGEITRLGRVWADGREIAPGRLNLRLYRGTEDQMPDPLIEAVEGAGNAPAYRGLAYVVIEDLELEEFGNRVPQFSFEVTRPAQAGATSLGAQVRALALIPGTGEYGLATRIVHYDKGFGKKAPANAHSASGRSDFLTSFDMAAEEAPNLSSVALVVSWFGDDLRCGQASLRPKVEQKAADGRNMPWVVGGVDRAAAQKVPADAQGNLVYGGTPADAAVVEALQAIAAAGKRAVFYPFILMDQVTGNGLTNPWDGATEQPALPWRGRITLSMAPGQPGSPDGTAAARAEVDAFFGSAQPGDFTQAAGQVAYAGPAEWSYRRMVLHYAHLCALAGGVDAFLVGSELVGLLRIRDETGGFPAVQQMAQLVTDVRAILGAGTKIGYAADWSEYFGYQPQDGSGDVYFHLDPLWAHPDVDFIGIDNYMPLADWRDGAGHADAAWGSIHDLGYLRSNIEGGEGFDWYYASETDAEAQIRSPIQDGAHGEDWIFRFKDIRGWWSNPHHERLGGVRQATPTAWVPRSKPIWFTEIGCAAIDKGANQPNKFIDAKSSESALPRHSNGLRDDLMQMQFLLAVLGYWADAANNPVSDVYGGPMIDIDRAHVWAWYTRPYPQFPGRPDLWSDAVNYARGHWLNGRIGAVSLAGAIETICGEAGLADLDVSGVHGIVAGYDLTGARTARAALQPLMLAHGVHVAETGAAVRFRMEDAQPVAVLEAGALAVGLDGLDGWEKVREAALERPERVRLAHVEAGADYAYRVEEAAVATPGGGSFDAAELAMVLPDAQARQVAARWLAKGRVAGDGLRLALPPSRGDLLPGDVVQIDEAGLAGRYRLERLSLGAGQLAEASRVEPETLAQADPSDPPPRLAPVVVPGPVEALFLDLPLLRGDEVPHAPHLAVAAEPWPGSVAAHLSDSDQNYALVDVIDAPAIMGRTLGDLAAAPAGVIDRGAPLVVELVSGALASCTEDEMLNGRNLAAIGDGSTGNWEVFQFAGASLIGPNQYALTQRLRGQAGSDALDSLAWPAGSYFVLLDSGARQVDPGVGNIGLDRHWRIGPADLPYTDAAYDHSVQRLEGIGRRPLAPVHLQASLTGAGDIDLRWIRRGRVGGDGWGVADVPLGEENELYLVQVRVGGQLLREETSAQPQWTYGAAARAQDGASGQIELAVAQVSAVFGPGLFRKVQINV